MLVYLALMTKNKSNIQIIDISRVSAAHSCYEYSEHYTLKQYVNKHTNN